jgi:DNA-binding LacI/PurR family transcriptional regulator
VLYLSQGMSEQEKHAMNHGLFARRPIGIISDSSHFTPAEIELAHAMGVKHILFIAIEPELRQDGYVIALPTHTAGYLAARHLIERGHRHLALVEPDDAVQAGAFVQRREGMLAALAEVPSGKLDILPLHLDAASAYTIVETHFLGADRPTGNG